jgi:hypothetical protein
MKKGDYPYKLFIKADNNFSRKIGSISGGNS